jgi:hypothetical protein
LPDRGPFFERGCLPPSLTRVCCVPCPVENLVEVQIHGEIVLIGGARSEVPEVMLALPRLAYLDVSGGRQQGGGGVPVFCCMRVWFCCSFATTHATCVAPLSPPTNPCCRVYL